jgi:hypothetical protein
MLYQVLKSILLFSLLLLSIVCLRFDNIAAALHHHYYVAEPDAYTHMVIARDVLKHHNWHQHMNPRINAPLGTDTHTLTRLVNTIIISGASLLSFFKPIDEALSIWCFILPMLGNALAAYLLLWSIKPYRPSIYQHIFILLAFLFNPLINHFFIPLRVDYDFLLIPLSIAYWACFLRLLLGQRSWVIATGIIAGLGIWTSISFIIFVLMSLTFVLGLLLYKKRDDFNTIKHFLLVLCLMFVIIIPFEHAQFFTISYDILSIVHLSFFFLLWLSLQFYHYWIHPLKRWMRILAVLALLLSNTLILNALFPGFYNGPYNQIDPYLLQHFFPVLSECYSPFKLSNALSLAFLSYVIIGSTYFLYLYLDRRSQNRSLNSPVCFLLWSSLTMTALTLYMYRWSEYALPLNILCVSFFVSHCCQKLKHFAAICFILAMALMPASILRLENKPLDNHPCREQLQNMLQEGLLETPTFKHDKILFAESNYGSLILYLSDYSIIATNDHHNPMGIKDSFNFFKTDEDTAKGMIMRRKVDLILLCKNKQPTGFDINQSTWLQRIPLPKIYSQWQLYRRSDP